MSIPAGHLDSMCIPIRKVAEDDTTVTYRFESDYWVKNPEYPSRHKIYCTYYGEILVDKDTKECVVATAMPHDTGKVSSRALRAVVGHVERGAYPATTMWACG